MAALQLYVYIFEYRCWQHKAVQIKYVAYYRYIFPVKCIYFLEQH